MKSYLFFIILSFFAGLKNETKINFEQQAVDYFFETIFKENYPKVRVLAFKGHTEKFLSTFAYAKDCFDEENHSILELLYTTKDPSPEKVLPINVKNIEVVKFRKRAKHKLFVEKANKLKDTYLCKGKYLPASSLYRCLFF